MSLTAYLMKDYLKHQDRRIEELEIQMATIAENVATLTATNATLEAAIATLTADFAAGSGGDNTALDAITTTITNNVNGLVAAVTTPPTPPVAATLSVSPSSVSAGGTSLTLTVTGVGTDFPIGTAPLVLTGSGGTGSVPVGGSVVSETVTDGLNATVIINAPSAPGPFAIQDTATGAFVTLTAV